MSAIVKVGDLSIGNEEPVTIIAGPCALESREHALEMAGALKEISRDLGFGLIYKTSFDKANRTALTAERGVGMAKGLHRKLPDRGVEVQFFELPETKIELIAPLGANSSVQAFLDKREPEWPDP